MRGPRGRRALAALLLSLAAALCLPASPVFAHAQFLGADPADGSVLQAAPSTVTLRFSEPVLASASSVTLLVLGTENSIDLDVRTVGDGSTLVATVPHSVATGAYLLRFTAIDPSDLHKTVGTVSFGVGVEAPPSQAGDQVGSPWWTTVLRAAGSVLLVLVVGATTVVLLALRRGMRPPATARRLVRLAAPSLAVVWIGLFLSDVADVGFAHARWGTLLVSSGPGRRALLGAAVAGAIWWLVPMLAAVGAQRFVARVLAVLVAGVVVLAASGGHTGVGGSPWVGLLLRVVHLASLSVWLGAVAVTWWVHRTSADDDVRPLWPGVSALAAVGVLGTGVSGLLLSARVVHTVTGLLGTEYGGVLVAKASLLLVAGALGLFAARRVTAGTTPRGLASELAVAFVAVCLAAFLAGAAPAVGERFEPVPEAVPQVITGDLADLTVNVSVQPSRPGPNLVRVRVLDTRRPPLGTVDGVTVVVRRADGSEVDRRTAVPSGGVVEWADVELASPGGYSLEVHVDRPAAPVGAVTAEVEVAGTPVPRAATVLSDARWAPWAFAGVAVWTVLCVSGRLLSQRRTPQASNR